MITWTIKVFTTSDETRDVAIRDKQGVPTQMTRKMRFVTIHGLYHDASTKSDRPVVLKTIDPPANFVLPKNGDTYTSTPMRSYKETEGVPVINF